MIEIRTERLTLRPVEMTEAANVAALITENISYWTSRIPWPYSTDDAKSWIAGAQPWEKLGIYLSNELIGTLSLPLSDDVEIGFIISENHRDKGFVTEAAKAGIEYTFNNFALNFISSSAHPENGASLRVHEKLGFKIIKETTHFWPNKNKDIPVILLRLTR